ncbi:alcohol dehydrogenase catalytic domain-containing protein [Subtercola boreus]|uniref:alcohol dehydrogenase catalytic domain-containing protein n=1 Tax=Subtercola boreus TaxID=120213 RepID=UPI00209C02F7|nr:alcohol dehydrogenase catalytic domain-containing protein [Subtercola boreus]
MQSLRAGDIVGAAWLRNTCGVCAWCRTGRENLCPTAEFTGWGWHTGNLRLRFERPPHGTDGCRERNSGVCGDPR